MLEINLYDHLRQFGYAPGNYYIICSSCQDSKVADKRAITCLECATRIYEAQNMAATNHVHSPVRPAEELSQTLTRLNSIESEIATAKDRLRNIATSISGILTDTKEVLVTDSLREDSTTSLNERLLFIIESIRDLNNQLDDLDSRIDF